MKSLRSLAALLVLVQALAAQTTPRLAYRVEVKADDLSSFHHALVIEQPGRDEVRLSVAAWAPGSYRLMNAFNRIKDVAAIDERGATRAVTKDGDLTWVADAKGVERLTVSWRFEESTRNPNNRTYLNDTGALLDGPRNYLYWRDRKDLPAHVHFKLPEGWKIATGLSPTFDPNVYVANDTDWLLDCPVLMGRLETWTFLEAGVPHRVAVDNRGRPIEFDAAQFVECIRRIVRSTAAVWGQIPYPHYTFLYSAGGGGGLEHLTSTTIGIGSRQLASNPNAHQGVTAHELIHAWNVKRLRPKALGPFDYDGPVRTKSLWISEGITNYYTNVVLSRAGLSDEGDFLGTYEAIVGGVIANPAYRMISPEEASWTVWDGPYLGSSVSYYTQGEYLGLLMDLQIRAATQNTKSLDDAMRLLYERFSGPKGFQSEDVVSTVRDATGVDLHGFFLRHVSGAREIEWEKYFRHMGCLATVARRPRTAINLQIAQGGTDGVAVKVPADSALFRLGLRDDDTVTAVNGAAVKTGRELLEALRTIDVGAPIELGVTRDGKPVPLKGRIEASLDVADLLGRGRGERLVVSRVAEDSELAASGFKNGDVVTGLNGVALKTREEWRAAVAKLRDQELVKVTVERGGAEHLIEHRAGPAVTVSFTLKPDPAATPLELAIRRGIIHGDAPPAEAAAESRPVRKAG
jgi:predicted metalloprotease with PDZ domain